MGKRRGEVEEAVKRAFFSPDRGKYVIYVLDRAEGRSELKPIPADKISDVRGGYIFVGGEAIPFHRVYEVRDKENRVVYKRRAPR